MEKRKTLRQMLSDDKAYIVPGVFDCIGAKVAENAGFKLIAVTGNGAAASMAGLPDLGIVTMTEVINCSKNIADCTDIPVIADADTGFGQTLNIMRTVHEFETAGLSGIHIEDQVSPKKCPYYGGNKHEVVSVEHHVNTLKAAQAARKDKDFCIISRTDAIVSYGFDEAVSRSNQYLEAGADAAFIVGLSSIEEVERAVKLVKGPLIVNVNDTSPLNAFSEERYRQAGAKLILYPATIRNVFLKQAMEAMLHLKQHGNTRQILEKFASLKEFRDLVELGRYEELEREFATLTD